MLAAGLFVLLALSGVLATRNVDAGEPTAVMRIDPATQNVLAGVNVFIEIRVEDVTGLGAYEFELHYDPLVLTFVSVANGPFLGRLCSLRSTPT